MILYVNLLLSQVVCMCVVCIVAVIVTNYVVEQLVEIMLQNSTTCLDSNDELITRYHIPSKRHNPNPNFLAIKLVLV